MNILLINHYAGSPEMGMEFRPYNFAKKWVEMGHKVTIIAGDYSHLRIYNPEINEDFEEHNLKGINYCWVKSGKYNNNGLKRAFSIFRFVNKLFLNARKIAERFSPDVVIASSTYPLDTYPAQKISKIAEAKYIHEVHDMWPSSLYEVGGMSKKHPFVKIIQIAEDEAYKSCDALISLAPYTLDYMRQHGLDEYKFNNIQNGIDEDEWKTYKMIPQKHKELFSRINDKFVVGYFGGHAISNALDTLLDVAIEIDDPDIVFVLVGKGMQKNRLIQRVENERIDNVVFLPPVEKSAIPDLLTYFDISYIGGNPSPLYRFGLCINKMYDSMMGGLPIVCAITAPNTLIDECGCGLMVDSNKISDITSAIRKIKNLDEKERKDMGQRGKKLILEKYTYEKLSQKYLRILEAQVIGEK